jgi:Helix-loop-helix DNA-binding domain
MPFDYRQFHTTSLSAPQECYAADSGTSSDCFAGAVSAANPASLQYAPEAPLSLMVAEEEGEEEGEERVEKEPSPKPRKQHKRGRPKLNRHGSGSSSSKRVPHSQVERKYRETLNAEMERLRINIPTLPYDGSSLPLPKKPSKAAVIAAAVDYIKQLEAETERFANENEDLRSERYDCI